jgi:hypothetical protein
MKTTRHMATQDRQTEQIIIKLRTVEAALVEGRTVADAVRDIGVSEQTRR